MFTSQENCNVWGQGIDLRMSQRFVLGTIDCTAEDEPPFKLFSFQADQMPVAFYDVATLSLTTLSPILGFRFYITSIQRSKAASQIVNDGYLIDHHPTKRSLFAAGVIGCPSATQQDSGRPSTARWHIRGRQLGGFRCSGPRHESTRVALRDCTRTHTYMHVLCLWNVQKMASPLELSRFVHRVDGRVE